MIDFPALVELGKDIVQLRKELNGVGLIRSEELDLIVKAVIAEAVRKLYKETL